MNQSKQIIKFLVKHMCFLALIVLYLIAVQLYFDFRAKTFQYLNPLPVLIEFSPILWGALSCGVFFSETGSRQQIIFDQWDSVSHLWYCNFYLRSGKRMVPLSRRCQNILPCIERNEPCYGMKIKRATRMTAKNPAV